MSAVTGPGAGWKYCGDCGKQLRVTASTCEFCGWDDPNTGTTAGAGGDHGCAFEMNGARCPLPGVHSEVANGKSQHWWCWVHESDRHYDAEAARQLQAIIENPRQYLRLDRWRDDMVREIAAGHPEWNRRDDETRSEYRQRMMKLARGMSGRLRQKMARVSTPAQGGNEGADSPAAAPSPRPAPDAPPSAAELVEDAMDQLGDLTAKFEEQGMATEIAQRLAMEHVLEVRARAWGAGA